jgi:hypothetical protein
MVPGDIAPLLDEALRLSERDRADLAARLIESLDGDPDTERFCGDMSFPSTRGQPMRG